MSYVLIYAIFAFQTVATEQVYFATLEQCEGAGKAMTDKVIADAAVQVRWHCAGREATPSGKQ
jgi:hypothetical protein